MKKYFLGVSCAVLMMAGNVYAADVVQTYDAPAIAPAAVAPAFSWDGSYIGGQIGGSWGDGDSFLRYYPAGGSSFDLYGFSQNVNGFVGGIYAGYNFSFANNLILGLETDIALGNVDEQTGYRTFTDPGGFGDDVVARLNIEQKWAGATRVRFGYNMDRFLPYVATGVAYGKIEHTLEGWAENPVGSGIRVPGSEFSEKIGNTFTGWTVGAGFDYAATDNVLLRLEYRYADYGSKTHHESVGGGDTVGHKIDHKTNDVRVGVAYKF